MSNNVHFNKITTNSSDSYFYSDLVLSIFTNGLASSNGLVPSKTLTHLYLTNDLVIISLIYILINNMFYHQSCLNY